MSRPASHAAVFWACGLLVLAAVAAYANSFSGALILDDAPSITDNPTIRHLWPLSAPLSPPSGTGRTVGGRPLLNLSLAVNYALSGEKLGSYHALNLLIHLLAGLLLFGMIRRTLERTSSAHPFMAESTTIAFVAALLWILHPLQTESVTYLIQRAESLMGLFYLLTLYGFIRAAGATGTPRLWLWASFLACLAGMATKEVMVSAPLTVLLYDRVFVAGSFGAALKRRRSYYGALALTWILLVALVAKEGNRGGTSGFGSGASAFTYWLSQGPAVLRYLQLSVWPHPLILDYGVWTFGSPVLAGIAGLMVLGLATLALWAWKRKPALGFLGWVFFAILAPTSLIPGNRQTLAEHRMYLPLAAVLILLVLAVSRWAGKRGLAALVACAVLLGGLTFARNRDYASPEAMFADAAAKLPSNPYSQNNLGVALVGSGKISEALAHYREATRLWPGYAEAHDNLGSALLRLGRTGEALPEIEEALRLNPHSGSAHENLGTAYFNLGRWADAQSQFEEALRSRPDDATAHNGLGNVLARLGQTDRAVAEYEEALRLRPDYGGAYVDLANALAAAGRTDQALTAYQAALKADPADANAYYNYANTLSRLNRLPEAVEAFRSALRLKPGLAAAHLNLGNALYRLEKPDLAVAEYREAVRLTPGNPLAHYGLANGLLRLGRTGEAIGQLRAALELRPDFPEASQLLERLGASP